MSWFLTSFFFYYIVTVETFVCNQSDYNRQYERKICYKRTSSDVVVDYVNALGIKLLALHNENNHNNNIALSPYGALSVLVALAEGVQGSAVYEIFHALQIPGNIAEIRVGLRDIHRHLKSYFIPEEGFLGGLTFNDDRIELNPEYEEILRFYGYNVELFNSPLYPEPVPTQSTETTTMVSESKTEMFETETTTLPTEPEITTELPLQLSTETTGAPTTTQIVTETSDVPTTQIITELPSDAPSTIKIVTELPVQSSTETSELPTTSQITELPSTETTGAPSTINIITELPVQSTTETNEVPSTSQVTELPSTEIGTPSTTNIPVQSSTETTTLPGTTEFQSETTENPIISSTTQEENEITTTDEDYPTSSTEDDRILFPPTTRDAIEKLRSILKIPDDSTTSETAAVVNEISSTTEVFGVAPESNLRKKRAVVDYLIARYLDDKVIGNSLRRRSHHWDDKVIGNSPRRRSHRWDDKLIGNSPYWTDDLSFFVYNQYRERNINFMQYQTYLPYAYLNGLKAHALSFPLDNTKYHLLLLLPFEENGVDQLICDLQHFGDLRFITEVLEPSFVTATIPSFMLKGYVLLTSTLQKLGIRKVFEPRQADFSPMTPQRDIYVKNVEQAITVNIRNYMNPLKVSHSNQRYPNRMYLNFQATYPFLYFVMDSEMHVALMAGKVVNPLNSRIK